jgi:DNA-directed RNA polymerase alpha subunit
MKKMDNLFLSSDFQSDIVPQINFSVHLLTKVSDLYFSARTDNCLRNEKIIYLGDLVTLNEKQVLKFSHLGKKSLLELKSRLATLGLTMDMDVPEWPPANIEELTQSIKNFKNSIIKSDETTECEIKIGNTIHQFDLQHTKKIEIPFSPHLLKKIANLNLSVRTNNCLCRENIIYIGDLVKLTESQIHAFPNFGKKSYYELVEILQKYDLRFGMKVPGWPPENIKTLTNNINNLEYIQSEPIDQLEEEILDEESAIDKYIKMGLLKKIDFLNFSRRVTTIFNKNGVVYIGDVLQKNESDLLKTLGRASFNKLTSDLKKLDLSFDIKLKYWPIKNIESLITRQFNTCTPTSQETLYEALSRTYTNGADSRRTLIMESRFGCHGTPRTLNNLAKELKITRERVRQIEREIIKNLNREPWTETLRIRLQKLMTNRTEPLFLDNLEKEDTWFKGFSDNFLYLEKILNVFSNLENFSLLTSNGRKIITCITEPAWKSIRDDCLNILEHSLDNRFTFSDIEAFVCSKVTTAGAPELSSLLLEEIYKNLNFLDINGESILVSVGTSLTNQLFALLNTIEKPIHFEKIASLYSEKFHLPLSSKNIHACLNARSCRSTTGFLLFDRGTYGLLRHLTIPRSTQDEILQRLEAIILEQPGHRQWHVAELIQKAKLNTYGSVFNKYNINIILMSSTQLTYMGRLAWKIKTIGDTETQRFEIRTAIYEVLKSSGRPLYTSELQERISKVRGINDTFTPQPNDIYSRVDLTMWGLLERDFVISLTDQRILKDKFFEYFSNSNKALHNSELLFAFDYPQNRRDLTCSHVYGILIADPRFKSWQGGFIGLDGWLATNRKSFTIVLKEILETLTGDIQIDEIISRVQAEISYGFNRNSLPVYLNKYGLIYDRDKGSWSKKSDLTN